SARSAARRSPARRSARRARPSATSGPSSDTSDFFDLSASLPGAPALRNRHSRHDGGLATHGNPMASNPRVDLFVIGAGSGGVRLVAPDEVEVDGERWRARHILVATGGHPLLPTVPGIELAVSSNAMFDLPKFPQRLVVVGAGYIACEMASIFRGLGAQVTQLIRGTQILRGFDDDVATFLAAEMAKKGVQQRFRSHVLRIDRPADGLRIGLHDGQVLEADTVLYATGRGPNTKGLGLEEVGVHLGARGQVDTDAQYHSNLPSIYAGGDVTDKVQLTPVALAEAR